MSSVRKARIEEEGRALVERLGGRWGPQGGMCRCPAHDDRTPSLSVRPGRSRLLLHCFAGCDTRLVVRALTSTGLIAAAGGVPGEATARVPTNTAFSQAALRIWRGARAVAGTPAARYLAARGIETASSELRYHPRTPHGSQPLTCFRPALVAAVRDETGLVAVHRSFLDRRRPRLARLSQPKRGLGRYGRGAVRLGGVAATLGLAEGIETALSASRLFGIPCWATLGTERFGRVALPDAVDELLLFLDNDHGGRRAETLAREALRISTIEAHYPQAEGDDWNDVLRAALSDRGGR